ncbi:MAG: hypothetical protein V4478_01610 [Patescibacteria group bacterium]
MKLSNKKLSVLFAAIGLLAVFMCVKIIQADAGSNMYGYAWSSNIGWIKLDDCDTPSGSSSNCYSATSYGVSVLPVAPGTLSGYAWSSNIGWISFNATSCPIAGCTPGAYADWDHKNSDGSVNIKGWAQACSVYVSGCSGPLQSAAILGGWDGYIALDGANAGGTGSAWGLKILSDNSIVGFAWGSEVLGWIKSITGAVSFDGISAHISANPSTIDKGASSTLTITATNIAGAGSCSIPGVPAFVMTPNGANNAWTGTVSVSPAFPTSYTVTCVNNSRSATDTTTVNVLYFGTPSGPGGSGAGGGYCAITSPQLSWSTDATTCTITSSAGGSETVSNNSKDEGGALGSDGLYYYTPGMPVSGGSTTYKLQCTGGAKPYSASLTVTACVKDYAVIPSPSSQTLVPSADGKTMTAAFNVTIAPQNGFTGPVDLSIQSWPATIPGSRSGTFDTQTLTFNGSSYGTAVLTVTINTADLKQSATYAPIIIKGTSGTLTRTAQVSVGSVVKVKPVYGEF